MKKSYAAVVVSTSTPGQLSKLLRLSPKTSESWQPEDLRAMVLHQMSALLAFDLGSLKLSPPGQTTASESLEAAARSDIKTFADLFQSPHPPIELLRLSHKFFKEQVTGHRQDSPEHKIACLFYILSIFVARLRLEVKISRLTDEELLRSVNSMIDRPWVDERVRGLLGDGRRRMSSEKSR
jgi:hypothetical protein